MNVHDMTPAPRQHNKYVMKSIFPAALHTPSSPDILALSLIHVLEVNQP